MKIIAIVNTVTFQDAATLQIDATITLADGSISLENTVPTDPTAADLRAGASADLLAFWNANLPGNQADGVILIGF